MGLDAIPDFLRDRDPLAPSANGHCAHRPASAFGVRDTPGGRPPSPVPALVQLALAFASGFAAGGLAWVWLDRLAGR
jgi:hypothetical protein